MGLDVIWLLVITDVPWRGVMQCLLLLGQDESRSAVEWNVPQPPARLLPFPPAARHRPALCRHSNGSSAVAGRAAPPRAAAHRAVARRINKSVSRWALQSEEGGLHTHSLYMET